MLRSAELLFHEPATSADNLCQLVEVGVCQFVAVRSANSGSGGALMDLGCYSLHTMRILAPKLGGEPNLISASAVERPGHPGVDESFTAELRFPNAVTGTAGCNMASDHHQMSYRLIGTAAEAVITDFVNPHNDDRLIVSTGNGT